MAHAKRPTLPRSGCPCQLDERRRRQGCLLRLQRPLARSTGSWDNTPEAVATVESPARLHSGCLIDVRHCAVAACRFGTCSHVRWQLRAMLCEA